MSNLHPIRMPKPIKAPTPKIARVDVHRLGNGFKVQHNMTHGPHPRPFVFSDPNKMTAHLRRIQSSAWRMPDRNEGHAITHEMNLGPVA